MMLPPLDAAIAAIKVQIEGCEAASGTILGRKWAVLEGMRSSLAAVERLQKERNDASLREAGYG